MPQEKFGKIVPSSSACLFYKRLPNKFLTYIPIKDKPFKEVIHAILCAGCAKQDDTSKVPQMSYKQIKELYSSDKYSKEELESIVLECAVNIINNFKVLKWIVENKDVELSFDAYRTSD